MCTSAQVLLEVAEAQKEDVDRAVRVAKKVGRCLELFSQPFELFS